jgi:UDP-GlcNAc:undecaprenyl-phosphate/decaprenyl-phosphate GlcNAc-1-phosphate transferase
MGQPYIAFSIAALLLSILLTRAVRDLAVAREWMAAPSSHHIHRKSIPRLGGVAIYLSVVAIAALMVAGSMLWDMEFGIEPRTILCILIPGTLIFLLGLYDDIYSVKPRVKFAVQAVAAVMLYSFGIGKFELPGMFGFNGLEWLTLPVMIIWVLWITNAFNLIDGLDGLAAGSSLFSTLTLFTFAVISGKSTVAALTLVMAGTILGFLRFNFNPATIFLGDSGSLFLGFMLSALSLAGSVKTPTVIAVALPIVSFGLPVLETSISIIRRFLSNQPLFSADREHIHHKLLERGLTQRQAVVILYGVSALCGLMSLFLLRPGGGIVAIILFTLGVAIWLGVRMLGYYEFNELGRAAQRTIDQKRIIGNNLALRRASNKLGEARSLLQICCILQGAFEANEFDGYQLSVKRAGDQSPLVSEIALLAPVHSGLQQHYAWHKAVDNDENESSLTPNWSLTLELETTDNQSFGCFSLYRTRGDRPLLVDFDLLTCEFRDALADAVVRVSGCAQQQTEEIDESSTLHNNVGKFDGEARRVSQLGFKTA